MGDLKGDPRKCMERWFETTAVYDHPLTTPPAEDRRHLGIFYPIMGHMCHVAVVEVDPATGKIDFLDYAAVHDAGTMVNPITLGGHIMGGTAMGIGRRYMRSSGTTKMANCSTRRSRIITCRPRMRSRR